MSDGASAVRFGLRANAGQFGLLMLINAFVGGMVGLERTVVPLVGTKEFDLLLNTVAVSFIISFGIVKACANLVSGNTRRPIWSQTHPRGLLGDRLARAFSSSCGHRIGIGLLSRMSS